MTPTSAPVAGVLLLDSHGRVLLQLRDGNTHIDPHRWCLPGGTVEVGEDPEAAALRELHEETGLKPDSALTLIFHGIAPSARYPGAQAEFFVYAATTSAGQDDVECNEGAAMTFVPADEVPNLEFGAAYARIVPAFLASDHYQQMIKGGGSV